MTTKKVTKHLSLRAEVNSQATTKPELSEQDKRLRDQIYFIKQKFASLTFDQKKNIAKIIYTNNPELMIEKNDGCTVRLHLVPEPVIESVIRSIKYFTGVESATGYH